MVYLSIVERAKIRVAAHLHDGALAIDATAGNGHDTLFLAERVGGSGHVYAFDVQEAALAQASRRLAEAGIADRATFLLHSHGEMAALLAEVADRVAVVMFNLGYLPGGDHAAITETAETIAALQGATELLAVNGVISVVAYPGHPGGREESETVAAWCNQLDPHQWQISSERVPGRLTAPQLWLVERR